MKSKRETQLLEELEHLKLLIQTHIDYKSVFWEGKEAEFQEHLNAMLDLYNDIREELDGLNIKKDNNDGLN